MLPSPRLVPLARQKKIILATSEIVLNNNEKLLNFDIGLLESSFTINEIEDAIQQGQNHILTFLSPDKER